MFLFDKILLYMDLKIVKYVSTTSFVDDIVILVEKIKYKENFIIL